MGVPGGWYPKPCQNIFQFDISSYQKNYRSSLTVQKVILGVSGWMLPPNCVKIFARYISTDINPQTMSNYFSLKSLLVSKKTRTLA